MSEDTGFAQTVDGGGRGAGDPSSEEEPRAHSPKAAASIRTERPTINMDGVKDCTELFQWAEQFRREHSLTKKDFLGLCGLESDRCALAFFRLDGVIRLSMKAGTTGRKLYDSLTRVREANPSPDPSPDFGSLENIWSEHGDELRRRGVLGYTENGDGIDVYYQKGRQDMNDQVVIDFLNRHNCTHIPSKIKCVETEHL